VKTPRPVSLGLVLLLGAALWVLATQWSANPDGLPALLRDVATQPGGRTAPADSRAADARRGVLPPRRVTELVLFHGRVVDPAGRPLAGAMVRLDYTVVCANSTGSFALPPLRRPLTITRRGYFSTRVDKLQPPADPATVTTFTLYPGCEVAGVVVDERGRPLADARVVLGADLAGRVDEVRTDADGRWQSPLRSAGPLHVLVVHPAGVPLEDTVILSRSGTTTEHRSVLRRGRPVRIRSVDARGQSLADVRLWVDEHAADAASAGSRYLGRTGDLGALECCLAPTARATTLRARLAGYRDAVATIEAGARTSKGRANVTISLEPAPLLQACAVEAATGLPIEIDSARLESLDGAAFRPVPHRGILFHSLARGKVRVGLPPQAGVYRLAVRGDGGLQGFSHEIEFDGTTSPGPIEIGLERRLELRGVVLDRGRPVADASVELIALPAHELAGATGDAGALDDDGDGWLAGEYVGRALTDAAGRFAFAIAQDRGVFRVRVRHPDYLGATSAPIHLPLPPGSGDEIPLVLSRGARVHGVVRREGGQPAADAPVLLAHGAEPPQLAWTDAAGRFEFAGLHADDDYRIAVGDPTRTPELYGTHGDGFVATGALALDGDLDVAPVEVASEADVSHDLVTSAPAPGSLRGRVRFDGEPYAATVRVLSLDATIPTRTFAVDGNGEFEIRRLPPGRYRVRTLGVQAARDVEVLPSGEATVAIDLEALRFTVELVSSATKRPLATETCTVALRRADGNMKPQRAVARDGSVEFGGLFPGDFLLHIEATGYVPTDRAVRIDSSRTGRVELEPGLASQIRLLTAAGQEYKGVVDFTIHKDGHEVARGRRVVDAVLKLPLLPRGRYNLRVRTEQGVIKQVLTISDRE